MMNFINKKIAMGSMAVICVGIFIFFKLSQQGETTSKLTIGILQTISHPAFDRVREGFIQEFKRHMDKPCTFVIQNAEGSMATAQTIAQSFHNNSKITALVALGTLATQALSKVEKQKPIIFSAVTDPVALGVISPTSNVCGVSDAVDIHMSAQMLKALCPQTKRVALLFNPAEANSVSLVQKMDNTLRQLGISPILFGIHNESEISSSVAIAMRKVDVLWIPTDNTIANAMSMVGQLALKAKNHFLFVIIC